ncbi:flavin-containing monooxygenase [Rhodococcoides fascians]|uniref:flavin-containing monooxygenase n=1 Tax=Rhodococcoides fascians TaxID=1828 RepID=UPI00050C635F|nr:NAD(P)/FAD-dependent oxidoreductase [Rhodococcus fascians]
MTAPVRHLSDAASAPQTEAVDIIVIGSGFAGIGMATRLRRNGETSFLVLERALGVGGTWRDNHYPGAECDVPSHLYSFSFRRNPRWSKVFAAQPEILEYLEETVRDEGLTDHLRFGAELLGAKWDEDSARWTVETPRGNYTCRILIAAAGHLSDVKWPDIAGLDTFTGERFHSADWKHDVSLADKRVGVVGSGASAIQIVPRLAGEAQHLTVFQRSAPYVTPRHDRHYTEAEKRTFSRLPARIDSLRAEFFWANESRFVERQAVPELLERVSNSALSHLRAQVDDPVLRAQLTPDYQIGCKRILKSNDYYPALCRDNVDLATGGLVSVEGNVAVSGDGGRHELDVLVAATGFEASDLPITYRIRGRGGRSLADQWATGMQAYATTTVNGFPNLFVMNGPNSGLGHNSVVYIIESQIEYIVGALEYMGSAGVTRLAVSKEAEELYASDLDRRSVGTVWVSGGCQNWYVDPRNGRLTTLWPDFAHTFREQNSSFDPSPYLPDPSVV